MTHIVLPKIESRTKIEALIGISITTLIGLMCQKIYMDLPIPVEIFWALALLGGFYFIMEFLTYVKFYIEKIIYLKEEETMSRIKILQLEVECRKLELQITLTKLKVVEV